MAYRNVGTSNYFKQSAQTMDYRKEIDGLRALAVIPVMFFHAGFQAFSGGFVGVDVFFVISGYLITSIILAEKQAGTFTLLNFYERRARRILPALFVVLFACLPFAWLWLPPVDMKSFAQSLMAVSGFASNVLFWQTSGYFETSAELKPLLHTWSLAVEEQYYLFFPVFLMLAWRLGKRWILTLLATLAVASLAAAQWGSVAQPAAAFYLLPTRGWELAIGAFSAFYLFDGDSSNINKSFSQVGSVAGLFLIIYAIFVFDRQTPFPSLYTLAPVIGTALIILFANHQTSVGKLLGHRLFVGVGLISYSAYLWHQPLLAFSKQSGFDEPSKLLLAALVAVAVVLAYLSWKYVEIPFRNKQRFSRKQIFVYGAIGSAFFVVFGLAGHMSSGFLKLKTTVAQRAVLASAASSPKRDDCHTGGADYRKAKDACEYQKGTLSWATFGDSHTVELAYALAERLKASDARLKHFSFSACIPTYGRVLDSSNYCASWTKESVENIGNDKNIQNVVVSYRINWDLFGEPANIYPGLPNEVSESERAQRWTSYVEVLRYFVSKGKNVFLVLQAPELPMPIYRLLFRVANSEDEVIGVKRPWWNERNKYVMMRLSEIPHQVKIIDPTNIFCDSIRCLAAKNGVAYYFDDDHMSVAGARLVVDEIVKQASRAVVQAKDSTAGVQKRIGVYHE